MTNMSKYIDAEKLIAELERRKKELFEIGGDTFENRWACGSLDSIKAFVISLQQEQPDFNDADPKHLAHSHCTKVREIKTGRVFLAEYSSDAAEWYETDTGKAYPISDVEIVKEQPEADLEKEIECSIRFLNGYHTLENGERWYKGRYEELRDFARHFYGLRNRALEEAARRVYESWNGGTMDDVRRDMVELGKVLNAREK